jgi:2-methylisocitrate lyase-like PEP mutase family enzyme
MSAQADKATEFLALHRPGDPLLMPNAWDAGSAKLFESMGFKAVATTSSGHAATLGRLDGEVTRDEAIAHAADLVAATGIPVSADLENAFADEPAGVAETIRLALDAGLAGCSVEDYSGDDDDPIYELELAVERIAAAVEVAHAGPVHLVISGRAENLLHGRDDLDDTIARLRAYQEAGADVLYAPGLRTPEQIKAVVSSVERPVNVLVRPGAPSVQELAELGVARISVGGQFAYAAIGGAVAAATELLERGTYGWGEAVKAGSGAVRRAFA